MGSMSMLQTPTSTSRDAVTAAAVAAAQKKKGIKSSLGRFFSKKEKVSWRRLLNCSKNSSDKIISGEGCQGLDARWFR